MGEWVWGFCGLGFRVWGLLGEGALQDKFELARGLKDLLGL